MSEPFTLTGHKPADGELPKGWRDSSLGEVAKFLNGRAYKKDELLESGKYRVLRVGNFFSNNSWYWSDLELEESKYCDRGDLLYAWSASFGPRIWDGEKVIFHYHIWRIVEDRDQVDKTWLRHWLDNDVERIKAAVGTGTTMMHVTKREMEKRAISIPSHAEQERIVEILEEQLSRLDTALESVRVVREKAAQFRRSLLHAAFTGTLTGHNPADGQLPEGWEISPIGDRCKIVSGSTPKTSVPEYWGGDIPWLTPDDLSKNRSKIVERGARSITRAGLDSCSTRLVPPGSVIFTSRAPIGYVAIAANEMCTNQGFKTAVPSSDIRSDFLYWQLQHVTPDIRSRASGTTFLEISGKGFAATKIVVPPLAEQERIVEILEEQLSRLDAALAVADAIEKRSAALRRSLLHAAFTGRLTEQWRESVHV